MVADRNSGARSAVVFLVLLLCFFRFPSEPDVDRLALRDFVSQLQRKGRVHWNEAESACDWVGVTCDASNSSVYSLRLPAVGLIGQIGKDTLGWLTQIRVLSLRLNGLYGSIPPDFSQLKFLRSLYLQGNQFSGQFPLQILELQRMVRLDLSSNRFIGPLPGGLNDLSNLTGFFVQNNSFSGEIPSITITCLVNFNVSYNKLVGRIPAPLQRFPSSAFAGNPGLWGGPRSLGGSQ